MTTTTTTDVVQTVSTEPTFAAEVLIFIGLIAVAGLTVFLIGAACEAVGKARRDRKYREEETNSALRGIQQQMIIQTDLMAGTYDDEEE